MDNELFINTEFPPPSEFEPPSSSSVMMLNWALMDPNPHQDSSFLWEKSTEQRQHHQQQQSIFDSALSSLVSSPTPSNSNFSGGCGGGGGGGGGDGFIIRELIGKLGNIGNINNNNSGEIYETPMSRSASCYTTPMNSPPPPPATTNSQMMMNRTTPLTEFSADPGFAERAARFSCFGSRSFNGRTNSSLPINNNIVNNSGKLTRVSSTPALKALVSPENISTTKPMIPGGEFSRKRKTLSKGKSKENLISTVSPSPSFSKTAEKKENWDGKGSKSIEEKGGKRRREEEDEEEEEGEGEGNKNNNTKPPEPPKDYIHVRARRGQATDSHSLAERVRREKIGERMKLLQDLVPGCNKVTGKALMLDEIINYVQSLQRQVEFLSMKLSSVNDTRLDFNVDALVSKDVMIPLSNNQLHEEVLQSKSSSHHHHQQQQLNNYNNNNNSHLHPNISSNNMMLQSPMNSFETSTLARSFTHLPTLTQFTDSISQYQMFSEEDLQSIVGMGVAQNPNHESQHMKIEL